MDSAGGYRRLRARKRSLIERNSSSTSSTSSSTSTLPEVFVNPGFKDNTLPEDMPSKHRTRLPKQGADGAGVEDSGLSASRLGVYAGAGISVFVVLGLAGIVVLFLRCRRGRGRKPVAYVAVNQDGEEDERWQQHPQGQEQQGLELQSAGFEGLEGEDIDDHLEEGVAGGDEPQPGALSQVEEVGGGQAAAVAAAAESGSLPIGYSTEL